MNFIVINEGFQCLNCGAEVPKHRGSCRNHCRECLYSRHVDAEFPGDRASHCEALMAPIGLTQSGKKGWIVLHKCTKCGRTIRNTLADDDNMEIAIALSRLPIDEAS